MNDRLGRLRAGLRLPLVAAPMFRVSGPALVTAACRAGVIGAFPTANCRTGDELDAWLDEIADALAAHADATGRAPPPYCPNLIVHRSNPRVKDDLARLLARKPELVITSVGTPAPVTGPLHDVGALVLADVATIQHAEKAAAAGADGLVLLTAGAGGQTGWLNPFAFVRAVRRFFDGLIVLAGGVSDGQALRAAEVLGADLAYMGTKFIATRESLAASPYKEMLVSSTADDILLTTAVTGLPTNILKPSLVRAGFDPAALPERGTLDVARDISIDAFEQRPARWRDIWSAGHSVSGVTEIVSVAELVARTEDEYQGLKGGSVTAP
jgi:nitronate monooxygenase